MPHDQFHLDFDAPVQAEQGNLLKSADVVSLGAFRVARQASELKSVYVEIFDSVSHVRLSRTSPAAEPPRSGAKKA